MKRLLLIFLFAPLLGMAQVITAGAPVTLSASSSGGGGPPTGAAGGVLSGTYPNPGFAASPTFTGTITGDNLLINNQTTLGNTSTDYGSKGVLLLRGLTEGIRFYTLPSGSVIEGVDNTGAGSYQPLSLGGSAVAITATGTTLGNFGATNITFTPAARASGAGAYFNITIPTDTAQTASTESLGFRTTTATRTWATTGTVALQRENYFAAPTYASASASQTFTDVFNTYFDKPIPGTNAIFTRPHTVGIVDATSAASSITGGLIVATTLGTAATSVGVGGGNVNAGGLITGGTVTSTGALTAGATSITGAAATTALTVVQTARTSGVLPYIKWTIPTDTAQTTATESPGVLSVTGTRTWAAGTVALQREINFVAPTYATATFTEAATLNVSGAPISGTGAAETTTDAVLIAAGAVNGAGTAPVTANSLKVLNPTGASGKNFAVQLGTSGTGIVNIRHGITGALSGGTLVVADAGATANTRYFFSAHALGTVTVTSAYYASARSAGVSFTVTASVPTDTSTVDWMAIEP